MDSMLQRHCAKFIYIVPDGLKELMSDISREVLRSQPEQIYTFIADYLDALMITRENARIAIRLVDSIVEIAETTVETLLEIGITRLEADIIVEIIQKHFKQHAEMKLRYAEIQGEGTDEELITQAILNELNIKLEHLEKVAVIIQRAYRKFKERQQREREVLYGMVDWRIAARSAIALYKKTGVTHYEAHRAATLIKAAYKGYYTRRVMKRLLKQAVEDEFIFEAVSVYSDNEETETGPSPTTHTTNYSTFEESIEEQTESTEAIFEPGSPYMDERTQPEEDGFTFPMDQLNFAEDEEEIYYIEANMKKEEAEYSAEEENAFEEIQEVAQIVPKEEPVEENVDQPVPQEPVEENLDETMPQELNVPTLEQPVPVEPKVETVEENVPQEPKDEVPEE